MEQKLYCCLIIIFWIPFQVFSQANLIEFDYEKSSFNENFPIPAEKHFAVTGQISTKVTMVEVAIYKNHHSQTPLFTNSWKRAFDLATQKFYIPIHTKLKGNEEYDWVINYYRQATEIEVSNLRKDLFAALDAYLSQSLGVGKSNLSLSKNSYQIISDLNSLVRDALTYYRNQANLSFEGFSDLVKNKIRQVEKHQIGTTKGLFLNKSKKEMMILTREKYHQELRAMVQEEVSFLFNMGLSVLGDSKKIHKVLTEKTQNYLTVHFGYGGAYLNQDDVKFDSGLHAGLTLPFGSKTLSKPFWSRSSLMAGVFLNNFEVNGTTVTGPIVGRPLYAGLGYKLVQFIKITAGATFLERPKLNNEGDEIYIRPFVGVVLELDIWFNLRR